MSAIAVEEAFEFLKGIETVEAGCEERNGVLYLHFAYPKWDAKRSFCFQKLAEHTKSRSNMSNKRFREVMRIVSAFVGPRKTHEARMRKACFARVMDALKKAVGSECDERKVKLIAGVAVGRCKRAGSCVRGDVSFSPAWDIETLTEFLRYRRHDMNAEAIRTKDDIERHVMRHFNVAELSCRRKVKAFVLRRRYFCRYYEKIETLKAIDCLFKYTASAYAFEKNFTAAPLLAALMPEVFFKKAGQKIRKRKYALVVA